MSKLLDAWPVPRGFKHLHQPGTTQGLEQYAGIYGGADLRADHDTRTRLYLAAANCSR